MIFSIRQFLEQLIILIQTTKKMIEKIGNFKKELSQIYEILCNQSLKGFWYPFGNEADFIIENLCKDLGFNNNCFTGWFSYIADNFEALDWHIDDEGNTDIAIAAFTHPTEIKDVALKDDEVKFIYSNFSHKNDLLSSKENPDSYKTIESSIGDMFRLKGNILHRTNPNAVGKKHFVFRVNLKNG